MGRIRCWRNLTHLSAVILCTPSPDQLNSLRDELAAKDTALRAALGDKEAAVAGLSNKMAALEAAGRGGVSAEAAAALEKKAGGLGGQLAAVQEELQVGKVYFLGTVGGYGKGARERPPQDCDWWCSHEVPVRLLAWQCRGGKPGRDGHAVC